jgi:hypothetical protein
MKLPNKPLYQWPAWQFWLVAFPAWLVGGLIAIYIAFGSIEKAAARGSEYLVIPALGSLAAIAGARYVVRRWNGL